MRAISGKKPLPARFNRKVLAGVLIVVAIIVFVALLFGLRPNQNVVNKRESVPHKRPDVEFLNHPMDYENLFAKEPVVVPKAEKKDTSELDKMRAENERLRELLSKKGQRNQQIVKDHRPKEGKPQKKTDPTVQKALESSIFFNTQNSNRTAKLDETTKPPEPTANSQQNNITERLANIQSGREASRSAAESGMNDMMSDFSSAMPGGGGSWKEQNDQAQKRDFRGNDALAKMYVSDELHAPVSPYEVKAGTVVPCTLITGLNSDLPGNVVAQVRENVYDTVSGNSLLIPQGTRVIGEYDSMVSYGQQRALLVFTRLVMPNGNSISLEGMPGVDLSGYAGLSDTVDEHWGRLLVGVVLSAVINASAAQLEDSQSGIYIKEAGSSFSNAAEKIVQRQLNIQPTLKVRPGWNFNVLVERDLILEPFEES